MGLAARSRAFVAQDGCAAQAVVISDAIDSASSRIVRVTGIATLGSRVFAATRAARPSAGPRGVTSERRVIARDLRGPRDGPFTEHGRQQSAKRTNQTDEPAERAGFAIVPR